MQDTERRDAASVSNGGRAIPRAYEAAVSELLDKICARLATELSAAGLAHDRAARLPVRVLDAHRVDEDGGVVEKAPQLSLGSLS